MNDPVVLIVSAACWGILATVWVVGALSNGARRGSAGHDAEHGPAGRRLSRHRPVGLIRATFLACVIVVIVGQALAPTFSVESPWLRAIGLPLLVASTAFAVCARLALGAAWSVAPRADEAEPLRTSGPYAITRHPIYTGILGMVLGTALAGGLGVWLVITVVVAIAFEAKIQMEEQLLLTTFPQEYPGYRARVPQLIPGLNALHRGAR